MTKTAMQKMQTDSASTLNLDNRVMLVALHRHQWGNRMNSNEADDVIAEHFQIDDNVKDDAGRYIKHLVDAAVLRPISKAFTKLRQEHYSRTLPWLDGGLRALSSDGYMAYMKMFREKQADLMAAVEVVAMDWDRIVAEAKLKRKALVADTDYPTVEEFREKHFVESLILPLPTKNDFRANLPADQIREVMANIEFKTQEAIQTAMMEVATRIKEVALKASQRLKNYKPKEMSADGKRAESNFHESLITNIRELVSLLPSLNIAGDPRISAIETELRAVAMYDAELLKADAGLRKTTAARAQAIVDKMGDFI